MEEKVYFVLFNSDKEGLLMVADYNDEGCVLSKNISDVKMFDVIELIAFITVAHENLDDETLECFTMIRLGI